MRELLSCQACSRLSQYRASLKARYPDYHCLPVAATGPERARLLIVGLAPGLHGANASGRPFSGDASGKMLFDTLYRFGHADAAVGDGAGETGRLRGCRITNAVKCVPPLNRPSGAEIRRCNPYLRAEIAALDSGAVILALGAIAHRAVVAALGGVQARHPFAHLARHHLADGLGVIDSYHCSRYNVNTGRLNQAMFDRVFEHIDELLA